jgi:hypothetical protein
MREYTTKRAKKIAAHNKFAMYNARDSKRPTLCCPAFVFSQVIVVRGFFPGVGRFFFCARREAKNDDENRRFLY